MTSSPDSRFSSVLLVFPLMGIRTVALREVHGAGDTPGGSVQQKDPAPPSPLPSYRSPLRRLTQCDEGPSMHQRGQRMGHVILVGKRSLDL